MEARPPHSAPPRGQELEPLSMSFVKSSFPARKKTPPMCLRSYSLIHAALPALCAFVVSFATAQSQGPEITATLVGNAVRSATSRVVRGDDCYILGSDPSSEFGSGAFNLFRIDLVTSAVAPLIPDAQASALFRGHFYQNSLAADPVRNRIAFAGASIKNTSGPGAAYRIVVVDLETSSIKLFADNGRRNFHPVFSPDGSRIAFFSVDPAEEFHSDSRMGPLAGYSLHVVDLATGSERVLSEPALETSYECPPAWSPDGSSIAFVAVLLPGTTWQIHLAQADGSTSRSLQLNRGRSRNVNSVVWPAADFLCFNFQGLNEILTVSLHDQKLCVLPSTKASGCLSLSPDRSQVLYTDMTDPRKPVFRILDLEPQDVGARAEGSRSKHLNGVWILPDAPARK